VQNYYGYLGEGTLWLLYPKSRTGTSLRHERIVDAANGRAIPTLQADISHEDMDLEAARSSACRISHGLLLLATDLEHEALLAMTIYPFARVDHFNCKSWSGGLERRLADARNKLFVLHEHGTRNEEEPCTSHVKSRKFSWSESAMTIVLTMIGRE
jgi:hypothetical protein